METSENSDYSSFGPSLGPRLCSPLRAATVLGEPGPEEGTPVPGKRCSFGYPENQTQGPGEGWQLGWSTIPVGHIPPCSTTCNTTSGRLS